MIGVISLGLRRSSGLDYLITESILPKNPARDSYEWQTFHDGIDYYGEEEIVSTENCVVWSQNGVVRRVFRFDVEKETVTKALLTWFDKPSEESIKEYSKSNASSDGYSTSSQINVDSYEEISFVSQGISSHSGETVHLQLSRSRALVVILQQQAHIYHLNGPSHAISLTFDVERIFATPKGLLLQRKVKKELPLPATPVPPMVPFNSFIGSQLSQGMPATQSQPTEDTSQRKSSSWGMSTLPSSLAGLHFGSQTSLLDGAPRLYTLTDPVSQMGLAAEASDFTGSYQPISKDEEVLYVSSADETGSAQLSYNPLMLILMTSRERKTYTLWQASYSREASLSADAISRRRRLSSPTQKLRHSLAGRTSMNRASTAATSTRKKSAKDILGRNSTERTSFTTFHGGDNAQGDEPDLFPENDITSNLDMSFASPSTRTGLNRRTSSLLARAELFGHDTISHPAQPGLAAVPGRRGKDRASTGAASSMPGGGRISEITNRASMTRYSHDDDVSMLGSGLDEFMQDYDDLNDGELFAHLRHELTMTKIITGPVGDPFSSHDVSMLPSPDDVEVFTVQSVSGGTCSNVVVSMFIMNKMLSTLSEITMEIQQNNTSVAEGTPKVHLDTYRILADRMTFRVYRDVLDAIKLRDGSQTRAVRVSQGTNGVPMLSLIPRSFPQGAHLALGIEAQSEPISLSLPETNPHNDVHQDHATKLTHKEGLPNSFLRLSHPGLLGRFDLVDADDRHHTMKVVLRPRNPYIIQLLNICSAAIVDTAIVPDFFTLCWAVMFQTTSKKGVEDEWSAFVLTLFSFCLALLDGGSVGNTDQEKGISSIQTPRDQLDSSGAEIGSATTEFDTVDIHGEDMANGQWEWLRNRAKHLTGSSEQVASQSRPSHGNYAQKDKHPVYYAVTARECVSTTAIPNQIPYRQILTTLSTRDRPEAQQQVARILLALHLLREEQKLNILSDTQSAQSLGPILAQIGHWLGWSSWSFGPSSYYDLDDTTVSHIHFDLASYPLPSVLEPGQPPSVFNWLLDAVSQHNSTEFPKFGKLIQQVKTNRHAPSPPDTGQTVNKHVVDDQLPRLMIITRFFGRLHRLPGSAAYSAGEMFQFDESVLETLPEAIGVLVKDYARQQRVLHNFSTEPVPELIDSHKLTNSCCSGSTNSNARQLCADSVQKPGIKTTESLDGGDLQTLIYRKDTRLKEAATLLNSRLVAVGEFLPKTGVTEAQFLDEQNAFAQDLYKRTMALSAGEGLLFFCTRTPLPTQKIETPIFNTSCNIQPSNITVDVDKTPFGEDKAGWAYFHAGVAAGLYTTKTASTIDTSWLTLNKPADLGVRHAGLLLALGLNGHLKKMAKWLAFKYLTPKHDMTTIGLLLGLSASHFGTMDSMVTRLLSVHIPRLLPPGAAELNLSPLTQTAGVMGIGLLYCNTQHRRMSEVMLSELENVEAVDTAIQGANPGGSRKDEGYRLAAGFALGFINLGRGRDLKNLCDLRVAERLLSIVTGPREINVVHILDQATAGATIALALIFMKSEDVALAYRIEVPSIKSQLDYTRPDVLLLRTVTRNLIMWNEIEPTKMWIWRNLPSEVRDEIELDSMFGLNLPPSSDRIPLYNILAGLCWSISLKYAGTGSEPAINTLLSFYQTVSTTLSQTSSNSTTYDYRLATNALHRFLTLLALSLSTIGAGTGNLDILRHLRAAHANVTPNSTFGFHQANHIAMGALFLGHGRYTFGTNNLAIAALLCAFYPIFPKDAMDNAAHLQAFRHMWTFAAEPRCLLARDSVTKAAIVTPVAVHLRDGKTVLNLTAPQLLPELDTIAKVVTRSDEYWPVVLDFANDEGLLEAFRNCQTVWMTRKSLLDQFQTPFRVALATLSGDAGIRSEIETGNNGANTDPFSSIFNLDVFRNLGIGPAEAASLFPRGTLQLGSQHDEQRATGRKNGVQAQDNIPLETLLDCKTTGLDDLLTLTAGVESEDRDRLMGLKILFAWDDQVKRNKGGESEQEVHDDIALPKNWLPRGGVDDLKARVLMRVARDVGQGS